MGRLCILIPIAVLFRVRIVILILVLFREPIVGSIRMNLTLGIVGVDPGRVRLPPLRVFIDKMSMERLCSTCWVVGI